MSFSVMLAKKGDVFKNYRVLNIDENVGTYQDKTRHIVKFIDERRNEIVECCELTVGDKSKFTVNQLANFVVTMPGNSTNRPLIKMDQPLSAPEPVVLGEDQILPYREVVFLMRDAGKMAIEIHKGEVVTVEMIAETAENLAVRLLTGAQNIDDLYFKHKRKANGSA